MGSLRKVAYLGPSGTFTEMAVRGMFKDEERKPYSTIPKCIDGLAKGEVDYAVVPLENTIEGSVNLTLDYLIHKRDLPIIGEITIPIEQHLLVHPNNREHLKEINAVYSHPHAIAQCHEFLRLALADAEIHFMNSTSAAAKYVMEHPELKVAAIANELAASTYGLHIAERNIHDYSNNHTRFVILAKEGSTDTLDDREKTSEKTTMMVTLPSDYSGALHQVLSAFAWRKLNLSKIESRPMKTGLGNYFFIIDVEQLMDEVLIPGVIAELEALGCKVRVLGSYPCFNLNQQKSPTSVSGGMNAKE